MADITTTTTNSISSSISNKWLVSLKELRAEESELSSSSNGGCHSSAVPSPGRLHRDGRPPRPALPLSAASIASSFTSVTGFSLLFGMAGGLETLCGQAYVNLGAYYLVGTPVAVVLAFVVHKGAKGLLIGLASGSFVQAAAFALRIALSDWQQQASKARERVFHGEDDA